MAFTKSLLSALLWPAVGRFYGGLTFNEAFARAEALSRQEFGVILHCVDFEDMSIRWNTSTQFPDAWYNIQQEYQHALGAFARVKFKRGAVSIKLSQMGLRVDERCMRSAVEGLVRDAARLRVPLEFDMERADDISITLDVFRSAYRHYPDCRIALQACHMRTEQDLEELMKIAAKIRWVAGDAYGEGVTGSKALYAMRASGARRLLEKGKDPALAVVRNERFVDDLERMAQELKKPLHLAMLYGFRPQWQKRLLAKGHQVDVYIPYGRGWLPYGLRRVKFFANLLRERPRSFPREFFRIYRD